VAPVIELLWCDGCPSHEPALAQLRQTLADLGHPDVPVQMRHIATDDEAHAEHFVGSPTIRVDGADVLPEPGEAAALTCRVYRLRDGRYSPTPDPDDLKDALARMIA